MWYDGMLRVIRRSCICSLEERCIVVTTWQRLGSTPEDAVGFDHVASGNTCSLTIYHLSTLGRCIELRRRSQKQASKYFRNWQEELEEL